MNIELSWFLLLPVGLSALYGLTEYHVMIALGRSAERAAAQWFSVFLPMAVLTAAWAAVGFPLPIFYMLLYPARTARFIGSGFGQARRLFYLNLDYVNSLSLHLVFIGLAALMQGSTMHELLTNPVWRILSVSCLLLIGLLEDLASLCKKGLSRSLVAAAGSPEAHPFMAFLWFSNGYLLMDSLLCMADPDPVYTPLFLIGSSSILMLFQIRFLVHIDSLIRNNHLQEEHDALAAELAERDRSVGELRHLAERDTLTDVVSRRSAMDRLTLLLHSGQEFSLAFLDLDHLKQVNDQQGHDAGDRYLIKFTELLGARLRSGDVLARVGGDEFVVLMPGCDGETAAQRIGAIRDALPEAAAGSFRFSFGITHVAPGSGKDAETLLGEADRAMYRDKAKRR